MPLPQTGGASLLLPQTGGASLLLPQTVGASLLLPQTGGASLLLPRTGGVSVPPKSGGASVLPKTGGAIERSKTGGASVPPSCGPSMLPNTGGACNEPLLLLILPILPFLLALPDLLNVIHVGPESPTLILSSFEDKFPTMFVQNSADVPQKPYSEQHSLLFGHLLFPIEPPPQVPRPILSAFEEGVACHDPVLLPHAGCACHQPDGAIGLPPVS